MRKTVAVAAAAFLAACGSSSSSSSGPTRPTGALSGTLGGQSFTPAAAGVRAIVAGGTACTLPAFGGVQVSAKAVEIALNPATSDACADLNSAACAFHAGEHKARIVVAAIRLGGGAEPDLQPGVYTVGSSLAQMQPTSTSGVSAVAFGDVMSASACPGTLTPTSGGHVWIDTISGPVTGAMDVTFSDGSRLSGTFSAPLCGSAPAVCDTANLLAGGGLCTTPGSCAP